MKISDCVGERERQRERARELRRRPPSVRNMSGAAHAHGSLDRSRSLVYVRYESRREDEEKRLKVRQSMKPSRKKHYHFIQGLAMDMLANQRAKDGEQHFLFVFCPPSLTAA